MKTPQEEAEEMINLSEKAFVTRPPKSLGESIKLAIPLAQYIAVARAAKKLVQNVNGELVTDTTYLSREGAELLKELQALRATGKVIL